MVSTLRSMTSGAGNPGSQSALRKLNEQRIVEALMAGPATQAELSRHTGLSTATVSNIVKVLHDASVVATEPTTSSGRRALRVRLNSNSAVAVGIDFGRRHLRVVLANLAYEVLAEESMSLPLGHQADVSITAAVDVLDRLIAETGVRREDIVGVGAGIPGPIDHRTGTVVQGAILPEWVGFQILSHLEERLRLPVFVDNDANLGALSEITWGPHNGVSNLMFVKIGSGIGAGLILDGALFYGHVGVTGEIGHMTISEHGLMCRCGNRGCLETVSSTTTMSELLSRGEPEPLTPDDIVHRALGGSPAALRVLDDAGLATGRALGAVANLINPEVIVIGGPLAELGELLLEPIRRGLLRHAVPLIGETTTVAMSALGARAEVLGAAALVFQNADIARHT
ncbi:ROK family transcriptional regulator [Sinomonas sp. ASV486]|uniref:ROK family transcriptional regulator n=1 Tax=Sinomonas puerhi TaxID=3238584 RepID=A0AB39L8D6_9MICC|nr:ROK family transcriptional regulator [Sinomonas sp. ASV486]MDQ4490229.1 ROK family transcriptional regulator [Sinomonas sp. ASV486]